MVQSVINAIRGAGTEQLILVPNSRGSDVDHWNTYAPNGGALDSVAALTISDSANNFAFDMHAYQDNPRSATSNVDLLTPVTDWAIANGKRLFLSEFGVALLPLPQDTGDAILTYLEFSRPLADSSNFTHQI